MTAKLEELRQAIVMLSGPNGQVTAALDHCIALSQQPPAYAMSRTELLEEAREYMGWADGEDMSELHTPTRGAMLQSLVGFAASVAPSPQAVTVEGLMVVVMKWAVEFGPQLHLPLYAEANNVLRTRLDQYLNNR